MAITVPATGRTLRRSRALLVAGSLLAGSLLGAGTTALLTDDSAPAPAPAAAIDTPAADHVPAAPARHICSTRDPNVCSGP